MLYVLFVRFWVRIKKSYLLKGKYVYIFFNIRFLLFIESYCLIQRIRFEPWACGQKCSKNFGCGLSESVDKARIQRDSVKYNVTKRQSLVLMCEQASLNRPINSVIPATNNVLCLLSGYRVVHWTLCGRVASHLFFAKFWKKNVFIQITIVVRSEYET